MIGPLEIVIIVAILLVIFGARYLPQLGRSAGKGVRIGSKKGKELAAVAQEKAKDVDTKAIARQAGDHVREARELRDVVKGESSGATKEKASEPAKPETAEPATSEPGETAEPATSESATSETAESETPAPAEADSGSSRT